VHRTGFAVSLTPPGAGQLSHEPADAVSSRHEHRPRSQAGPPMTLGNLRTNGVRSLDVCCWLCHHRAILSADPWPDHVPVPTFGPRMVCTRCGIIGADARPNWHERPARLSGAGTALAMSTERHRALRLLAGSPLGATEAIMLAHGFTNAMLDTLVRDGLATAEQREMRAGRQPIKVIWLTITDAGRLALAG
jgi:hypothetical protein